MALAVALGALAPVPASAAPDASLPDGAYLFVSEEFDTSSTVRAFTAEGAQSASFTTPVAHRMVTGSAGSRLYTAGGNQIGVVDTASQQLLGTMALPGADTADPQNLSVTADGRRLFVLDAGNQAVQVFDTSTRALVASYGFGNVQAGPTTMAVTPDGVSRT